MRLYSTNLGQLQRPTTTQIRDIIEIPAIDEPHQGSSYNPPVGAHTELITKANRLEEKRFEEAEKLKAIKEKISGAVGDGVPGEDGVPAGMVVDNNANSDDEDGEVGDGDDAPLPKKMPARKTKQQKAKAARQRAEVRSSCLSMSLPALPIMFCLHRNAHLQKKLRVNASYTRLVQLNPFAQRYLARCQKPNKENFNDSLRLVIHSDEVVWPDSGWGSTRCLRRRLMCN